MKKTNQTKPAGKRTKPVSKKLALTLPSSLPIQAKSPTPKSSKTKLYYGCMNDCCQGQNITKAARDCKTNAPALLAAKTKERAKEVANIKKAWKVIAVSLSKLIPQP